MKIFRGQIEILVLHFSPDLLHFPAHSTLTIGHKFTPYTNVLVSHEKRSKRRIHAIETMFVANASAKLNSE